MALIKQSSGLEWEKNKAVARVRSYVDYPPEKRYDVLQSLYYSGNVNSFIQDALVNYDQFKGTQSDLLDLIRHILEIHSEFLTRRTVQCLCEFRHQRSINLIPAVFMELFSKNNAYEQPLPSEVPPGLILFPAAVETEGFLYQLRLVQDSNSNGVASRRLSSFETILLDITGAALFSWMNRKISRTMIWNPSSYTFVINNFFASEVDDVEGESMGLGMLIALFSLITNQPVPVDIIATGAVNRNETITPVGSIPQKLSVIEKEREYIKKVLIAHNQVLPKNLPQFEYIRVQRVSDVIDVVFPGLGQIPILLDIELDLDREIGLMNTQYKSYMLDTCMENAQRLINYIENKRKRKLKRENGMDMLVSHQFHCYWKLGACHCHKGHIELSKKYLHMAEKLYLRNRKRISDQDYYDSKNNYGVLLKDIFCYEEAEKIHLVVDQELKRCGTLYDCVCNNLSSLSQLFLARHDYRKAQSLQKEALKSIINTDTHRNLGYLAQIYTREGLFDKAQKTLNKARQQINDMTDGSIKQNQFSFYHWIESEFLYRKVCTLKRKPLTYYERLNKISHQYENIHFYGSALIQKFCALGILLIKKDPVYLKRLNKAQSFFDSKSDPMMCLLGATVRIEKLIVCYDLNIFEHNGFLGCDVAKDIHKVIEALSVQKNIHSFFKTKIARLQIFLKHAETQSSGVADVKSVINVLKAINHEIPY